MIAKKVKIIARAQDDIGEYEDYESYENRINEYLMTHSAEYIKNITVYETYTVVEFIT